MQCTGFFVIGNSSPITFDFMLPPADNNDPMVPVGYVVDVYVSYVFSVGLFGSEVFSFWHIHHLL